MDRDLQTLNDYIKEINHDNTRLQYKDYLAEQLDALLSLLRPALSATHIEFYSLVLALRTYEYVYEDRHFPFVVDPEEFQLSNYPWTDGGTGKPQNRVCLQFIRPGMEYVVVEGLVKEKPGDAIEAFLKELDDVAKKYLEASLDAEHTEGNAA